MGAYGYLVLNNYPIETDKNYVNPFMLGLFDSGDLTIFDPRERANKNLGLISDINKELDLAAVLSSNSNVLRDRLEVLGFTVKRAKQQFYDVKEEQISSWLSMSGSLKTNKDWIEHLEQKVKITQNCSFDEYLFSCKYLIEERINSIESLPEGAPNRKLVQHLLDDINGFAHYPRWDFRNFLRAIIEVFPDPFTLSYDISEIVYEQIIEGISAEDLYNQLIESGHDEQAFEYRIGDKTLILTEGSTDTEILKRSIRLLYPHLEQYYSFVDFESSYIQGGSGALTNTIKAFIGAGINNRIIGVYDNDTAGNSSMKLLTKLQLPHNLRIIKYPHLSLATSYPTMGPNGLTQLDINGLACSIELYLGLDVLNDDKGTKVPIQWTGFDKGIARYQGEIINKNAIQNQFFKKLKVCEKDPTSIKDYDWSGIRSILTCIFNVFNNH